MTAQLMNASRDARDRRLVRCWLYVVVLMLVAIVMVGGATRMTGSGLSITEWKPIHGVVPPLNQTEWQEEFEKYQQIPQYVEINKGMSLDDFKSIFWWEWAHRLLARLVGFVVALPLAFFWITGRLRGGLKYRMLGILALGGVQGAIGWWMVASGLSKLTSVSQYRLAIHLTTACVIITAVLYVARGLANYSQAPASRPIQRFAGWLVVAVLAQIYLGGLVAGLHAGLSYNTWPLMDGAIVPSDLFTQSPWWRNLFENPKTVQFVHRMMAYTVLLLAILHAAQVWRRAPDTTHARRAVLLVALVLVQAAFGVATLVMSVPLHLGLTHQAFALVVLAFAVAHWRGTKGAYAG